MERKTKVLVTGGRGFIGSCLVRELNKKGYRTAVFDLVDGMDITDRKMVLNKLKDYKIVFHLAGILGTHELNNKAYEATLN